MENHYGSRIRNPLIIKKGYNPFPICSIKGPYRGTVENLFSQGDLTGMLAESEYNVRFTIAGEGLVDSIKLTLEISVFPLDGDGYLGNPNLYFPLHVPCGIQLWIPYLPWEKEG